MVPCSDNCSKRNVAAKECVSCDVRIGDFDFDLTPLPEGYIYRDLALQVGGGLEYLHHILASRKRRLKGNTVPGGVTGPPCSWEI
jgi:hypothetical protein